jgi:glycine/D-amino acid oxidase-like deaminating enzyme
MSLPSQAEYVIVGAGIHGLSTAWRLAENLKAAGESIEGRIVIIDKADAIASGATGIACGVVRNNYFQPAMRKLMAHSVSIWESDPEAFSYHANGYMQISYEGMREDVRSIYEQQKAIGYESVFIEGEKESREYMLNLFDDWQAQNITSVLHEKPGGYANNVKAMEGLSKKVIDLGVTIVLNTEVTGFTTAGEGEPVTAVETSNGSIGCDNLVIGAGPWVRDFWTMLGLPSQIEMKDLEGNVHEGIDMWRFWQLEEGVLEVDPEMLVTNDGKIPPVLHVDTDAPLYSTVDGSLITDKLWGIYYKPDWNFGGIQGGAAPWQVPTPVDEVAIDPYGPASTEFVASKEFPEMWVSALAHCHKRFEGMMDKYHKEPSGGIGCMTADSFPVIDKFNGNVTIIADSNHGYKMLGVGCLVAEELLGEQQELLEPFRFSRFKEGKLHPVSNSPYPWS